MNINVSDLMDYTEWERNLWQEWLRRQGEQVLTINLGPNGDGRFEQVGHWIRHIFSAEMRYVDRLSNRSMTDTSDGPNRQHRSTLCSRTPKPKGAEAISGNDF